MLKPPTKFRSFIINVVYEFEDVIVLGNALNVGLAIYCDKIRILDTQDQIY